MLTWRRPEWVPRSIQCFLSQTYANRELLIVEDGEDSSRGLVPDDNRIRYVHLGGKMSIGNKRNAANSLARGEIICHWDDDDWSAPGRVAEQVQALLVNPNAMVAGYSAMPFQDVQTGEIRVYSGERDYCVGTSLCYWKRWWAHVKFLNVNVGEDNNFVFASAGRIVSASGIGMMVARNHHKTTDKRPAFKAWAVGTPEMVPESARI